MIQEMLQPGARALRVDDEMLMFSVNTLPELRDTSSQISPPSFPGKLAGRRAAGWLPSTRSVNTGSRVQREKASINCREG